jgi:hypothetical protein
MMIAVNDLIFRQAVVQHSLILGQFLDEQLLHWQDASLLHQLFHQFLSLGCHLAIVASLCHVLQVDDGAVVGDPLAKKIQQNLLVHEFLDQNQ